LIALFLSSVHITRVHGLLSKMMPVLTGRVGYTAREHGCYFLTMVFTGRIYTGREHGPWTRVVCIELWFNAVAW